MESTSVTKGTADFLVNRRMNKSQQMRRSQRGADFLLRVRCTVYNGTLGSGFGHRFDRLANTDPAFGRRCLIPQCLDGPDSPSKLSGH